MRTYQQGVRIYFVYDVCMHIQKLAVSPNPWPLSPAIWCHLEYDGRFCARLSDCSVMAVAA